MEQQESKEVGKGTTTEETKKRGPKPMPTAMLSSIDEKIISLESSITELKELMKKVLVKVNISDVPVTPPTKKNYNPDYLPVGGKPRGLDELPEKQL